MTHFNPDRDGCCTCVLCGTTELLIPSSAYFSLSLLSDRASSGDNSGRSFYIPTPLLASSALDRGPYSSSRSAEWLLSKLKAYAGGLLKRAGTRLGFPWVGD